MLCRMGGVGIWGLCCCVLCLGNNVRSTVSSYVCRDYMHIYNELMNMQCATLYKCSIYSYSGLDKYIHSDLVYYKHNGNDELHYVGAF